MTEADATPIRVMLADDHALVRSGLRSLLELESDIEVVAETANADDTVRRVRGHKPSVLLLDLFMPGRAPMEAIPDIREASPETKIVVLTMQDDPAYVKEAFKLGVAGYLIKDAADEDLTTAIRTVLGGATYLHPSLGARLAAAESGNAADPSAVLSPREIEVLQLIALGHTNKEIGEQLFLSVRTVESHRANIQEKLELSSRAELVRWAIEHDLLKLEGSPAG